MSRFQSFAAEQSDNASSSPTGQRIEQLRNWMSEQEIDGFLIPRSDEHQGEYVPACAERLSWLTGFTGSAGCALVTHNSGVMFVDGRYTLQAAQQVENDIFSVLDLISVGPVKWVSENGKAGMRLGIDPWLHTINQVKALEKSLQDIDGVLVAMECNGVDAIWHERPAPPQEKARIHPQEKAGTLAKYKLKEMAREIADAKCDATILTDPSSLAWTFNIRGHDVPHTPLALGFAIIGASGNHHIFLNSKKLDIETRAYLTQLCTLHEPDELEDEIIALSKQGSTIGLDYNLAAQKLHRLITDNGGKSRHLTDPASLPRACKNMSELAGSRAAHRRDGVAMCRYLHWLSLIEPDKVSEIDAAKKLEQLRIEAGENAQEPLRDISFDTISGSGPNGAIVHYRVNEQSNRLLGKNELYLVDSGGQYEDGTTDITRTVPIGTPSDDMRCHYTLVLKGMITVSLARFPDGIRGCDLDTLARMALWKEGLDYGHGTGHGVGSYLSVHEGPQRIARTGTQQLLPGMIISNEPGYYKTGHYGIRLENLIVVTPAQSIAGGEIEMHGFETLTLAPFDQRMIDSDLLTNEERLWLNAYHDWVWREIGPQLDGAAKDWLQRVCEPL